MDLLPHGKSSLEGPLKYLAWPLVYLCSKSPIEGAQTTIYCAVEESLSEESGHYYSDCARADPAPQAKDDDDARRLWKVSEQAVGIARLEEKKELFFFLLLLRPKLYCPEAAQNIHV